MDLHVWIGFVAASTVLLLIPGPTILLVLSYAISQGRRVALATAAGVALGDLIAMTTSLAGLGAIVLASAELFVLLKWVGAAYLVYLGIRMFLSAGDHKPDLAAEPEPLPARQVFIHAATVTALNPKSIVFFIAFVPQFITPNAVLLPQFAALIATFVGLAAINALTYALLADRLRRKIASPAFSAWLPRLSGGMLIAMGIATATYRRAAT